MKQGVATNLNRSKYLLVNILRNQMQADVDKVAEYVK